MTNIYEILKYPLSTEKAENQKEILKVTYRVCAKASKRDIKKAMEKLFNVSVSSVNTLNGRGKTKRVAKSIGKQGNYKKAVVTLKEGVSVDSLALV